MIKQDKPCPILITATGEHRLQVQLANSFLTRFKGLMLAAPLHRGQAMLLTRCSSVHTCFMRQHLDILYLDENGVVTKCVADLGAWRLSIGRGSTAAGAACAPAAHVLELAAGSIALLGITPGSRLQWGADDFAMTKRCAMTSLPAKNRSHFFKKRPSGGIGAQQGSAMIEFAVVAPIITLLGMASLQYGLIFFAKNQHNHAAFMAARAGSMGNANLETIAQAYATALVPLYGGGTSATELAKSHAKATASLAANTEITMLNPTVESFADFNDPALQQQLGLDKQRVIPNGGLAFKKAAIVQPQSGQNVQDANLLKLRITHGYKPQVPLVGALYLRYLKWLDRGVNKFHTQQIKAGFIPLVMNVSMQMQSDAIEGTTVSTPGPGNGGIANNPGHTPSVQGPPPACTSVFCATPVEQAGPTPSPSNPATPDAPVMPSDPEPTPGPGQAEPSMPEDPAPGGVCEAPAKLI